ncbi:MAG: DUF6554 family protein [Cyanobacteriota bacterium]|jgi:hypothetical protein
MVPRFLRPHWLGPSVAAMAFGWGALGLSLLPRAQAQAESPGVKGAQVYCYMRGNGNSHEVSWAAAYALIKRQSASMFKTSPTHAAVMITEAVVQNPNSFSNCGRYLGDLYSARVPVGQNTPPANEGPTTLPVQPDGQATPGGMTRSERYGN